LKTEIGEKNSELENVRTILSNKSAEVSNKIIEASELRQALSSKDSEIFELHSRLQHLQVN